MSNHDVRTGAGVEGYSDFQFEQLDPDEQEAHLDDLKRQLESQRDRFDGALKEQAQRDLHRLEAARHAAKFRAEEIEIEGVEEGAVSGGSRSGTIRPVAGFLGMRILMFVGDKIVNTPQRALSGWFKRLEQKGSDMIKKNAPWVSGIPLLGPWLLKKAEKSIAEREKEENEKREKERAKKEAEDAETSKLQKDLEAAKGDRKKEAKAYADYNKRMAKLRNQSGDDTGEAEPVVKAKPEPEPKDSGDTGKK